MNHKDRIGLYIHIPFCVRKCDYCDFLAGDPSAIKRFNGEFMSQFSWAEQAIGFLEQKALKKN